MVHNGEKTSSMNACGRLANQNILGENSGPTSYLKRNVISESFLSAWLLFKDS